ncbi:MAG: RNA polymerase sigma factor [Acidobacteriota bacterium]
MEKEERYASVIEEHKDRIYRICCCYVRDADRRADVYQQVLIHIWEHLDVFKGQAQVGTWIYRICVNTCLMELRSERKRKQVFVSGTDSAEASLMNYASPASSADTNEELEALYERINELPAGDRTILSLYLEDLSTKEMAEVLDLSESNVRVKIHRIKKTLKECMEREGHGR